MSRELILGVSKRKGSRTYKEWLMLDNRWRNYLINDLGVSEKEIDQYRADNYEYAR